MSDVSADRIAIWCAKKHTIAYPLFFEVRVQVELSHRQLAWSMTMLPGQSVPIHLLDINQQIILIAGENELLIDSSGLHRTIPIHFQEESSDQTETWPGSNLATEGLHILAVRMTDAQYIRREGKSPLF
jgi:hypothetical protein